MKVRNEGDTFTLGCWATNRQELDITQKIAGFGCTEWNTRSICGMSNASFRSSVDTLVLPHRLCGAARDGETEPSRYSTNVCGESKAVPTCVT